MNVFFDMEFTGLIKAASPLSIGLISEDGKTFYAEYQIEKSAVLSDWITENVIPNLRFRDVWSSVPTIDFDHYDMKGDVSQIRARLLEWLGQFDKVIMWGDCLAYDWVLFCDLWIGAMHIPDNIYYIPFDLSTLFYVKGIDPDINREDYLGMDHGAKHNALYDAKIIRKCYQKLLPWEGYDEI